VTAVPYDNREALLALRDRELVADLDTARRLHPLAVHMHLAARDGLLRQRARPEKARRPQPLVEPDLFVRVVHARMITDQVPAVWLAALPELLYLPSFESAPPTGAHRDPGFHPAPARRDRRTARSRPFEGRARHHLAAAGGHRGRGRRACPEFLREQLPRPR